MATQGNEQGQWLISVNGKIDDGFIIYSSLTFAETLENLNNLPAREKSKHRLYCVFPTLYKWESGRGFYKVGTITGDGTGGGIDIDDTTIAEIIDHLQTIITQNLSVINTQITEITTDTAFLTDEINSLITQNATLQGLINDLNGTINNVEREINEVTSTLLGLEYVHQVTYNQTTGDVTFTRSDNTFVVVNVLKDSLVSNWSYDSVNRKLIITLPDTSAVEIPVSDLIDDYTGFDGQHIETSIVAGNAIRADIKARSISFNELDPNLQAMVLSALASSDAVLITGAQTVLGLKTFNVSPQVPSKTTAPSLLNGTDIATEAQVATIGNVADAARIAAEHAATGADSALTQANNNGIRITNVSIVANAAREVAEGTASNLVTMKENLEDLIELLADRVDSLELLGVFKGLFATRVAVPDNISAFGGSISVNDFIVVAADETRGGVETRYIVSNINETTGVITWSYAGSQTVDTTGLARINDVVLLSGNQSVNGTKSFATEIVLPAKTSVPLLANERSPATEAQVAEARNFALSANTTANTALSNANTTAGTINELRTRIEVLEAGLAQALRLAQEAVGTANAKLDIWSGTQQEFNQLTPAERESGMHIIYCN